MCMAAGKLAACPTAITAWQAMKTMTLVVVTGSIMALASCSTSMAASELVDQQPVSAPHTTMPLTVCSVAPTVHTSMAMA